MVYLVHTLLPRPPLFFFNTQKVTNSLMSPDDLGSVATKMPSVAIKLFQKLIILHCFGDGVVGKFGWLVFTKEEPPVGMTSQLANPHSCLRSQDTFSFSVSGAELHLTAGFGAAVQELRQ